MITKPLNFDASYFTEEYDGVWQFYYGGSWGEPINRWSKAALVAFSKHLKQY